MDTATEDFLSHYGVRGMKWGVHNGEKGLNGTRQERKAAKKESKLAYKAWKKEVGGEKVANEIFQEAVKTSGPAIKAINNDRAFKGQDLTKDRRLASEYDRHVSQAFNDHMAAASLNRTLTNTGRAMLYQFDRNVGMMRATEVQAVVEHADDEGYPDFVADMDEQGKIISLRRAPEDEFLEQMDAAADFLEHYGVVGMKWGRRKSEARAERAAMAKAPASEESVKLQKVHVQAKVQKSTKALTNKELETAIKRMQLEQQYSKLSGGMDKTRRQKAANFIHEMVTGAGKNGAQQLANEEAKNQLRSVYEQAKKRAS